MCVMLAAPPGQSGPALLPRTCTPSSTSKMSACIWAHPVPHQAGHGRATPTDAACRRLTAAEAQVRDPHGGPSPDVSTALGRATRRAGFSGSEDVVPQCDRARRPTALGGGNHDAAVWAAAINVNTALKSKAERPDLGESRLVSAAFGTPVPEPGQVRLRLCDESNPDLFKDRHVGAINLGHGLFSGVRNPLNHVGAETQPNRKRWRRSQPGACSLGGWTGPKSCAGRSSPRPST